MKKSSEAVLLALLVVLVVVILYMGRSRGWMSGGCPAGCTCQRCREKFITDHPYSIIQHQNDSRRGMRNDGYGQTHPLDRVPVDQYYASGAYLRPEDIMKAEQQSWFATTQAAQTSGYNTEEGFDAGSDMSQYHDPSPGMDYGSYLTDNIVSPRLRENHGRWVEEMKPWSGVSKKVDDLEVENYLPRVGITAFRMPAPPQHNPMQLTEVDQNDHLAGGKNFLFQG